MGHPPAPRGQAPQPRVPHWVLGLALVVWAGILLSQMAALQPWHLQVLEQVLPLSRFGPFHASWFFSQLGTLSVNLAWGAVFFTAAFGLGAIILERLFPAPRPRLESLMFSLALGFAGLALLIFFLGIFHGLHAWLFAPLLVLLAAVGVLNWWRRRRAWAPAPGWFLGPRPPLADRALASLLVAVLAGALLNAGLPEMFFDSLVYHLGVPAQWIQRGAIVPLPTVFFSNLPMGIEMLYTGALLVSNEVLCRCLHVGLGILAALTVFALARRWFGRRAGLWAAGILGTIPLFIMNALVSGVDAGSVFFTAAALLALFNAGLAEAAPVREFWLAGLLTGAAVACKYNTAFLLGPAAALVLLVVYRQSGGWRKAGKASAQIALGAFLVFSPWLVKNTVFTGNPVYPFLYQIIPSRYVQPEKMKQQMDGFKEFGERSILQIARLPWDLTFYTPTANSYAGGVFLWLLPGFIWLAFKSRRAPPVQAVLLASAAAAAVIFASQTQIMRYFLPALAVLAVLGGALLVSWERYSPGAGKLARWCMLLLAGYALVNTAIIGLLNWDPLGAALGRQSRDAYLDEHLMTNYLPMARAVNALPGRVQVYLFGETRAYYFEKPVTAVTVYDANPLLGWLDAGPTAEAVGQRLRDAGYTHVMVHEQEAARTRGYEPYVWTPAAVSRWQEWLAHYTRRVALHGQLALYELLPAADPGRPVKPGRPLFTYSSEVVAKVTSHLQAAFAYEQQHRWLDAQVEWQRIMVLAPDWDLPYALLGWQFRRERRLAEAWDMYQRADGLADLDAPAYNDLGALAWELGKADDARRCLRLALAQDPNYNVARQNLANLEKAAPVSRPVGSRRR